MDWSQLMALVPDPATISVQALAGSGARGTVYATAATVEGCMVERRQRQVTVQTQDIAGAIVVSSTTVRCPPGTVAPLGSLVTIAGDATARKVLQRADWDAHGLDVVAHVELLLE